MTLVSVKMSASVSAILSHFLKKAIPIYAPNSITTRKPSKSPSLILTIPNKCHLQHKSNLTTAVAQLLQVRGQSIPPEIPSQTPPEFPTRPEYIPPSIPKDVPEFPEPPEIEISPPEVETQPPNVPEIPTPGPDFPVPPLPTPPTPPDVPLPPPGTPWPNPPDQLPPRLPPDPDILPPPNHPPPDIQLPPDIKPPPGPYVSFTL